MSNKSEAMLEQNRKKIEECRLSKLNSCAYKRGVPSALSCICPLENCGKTISRPRDLLIHIRAVHKLEHMWYCEICESFSPRVSDLVRHDLYVHKVAEWSNSSHFTTKEFSSSKERPLPFKAKEYQRGLTKAGRALAPYPKVL